MIVGELFREVDRMNLQAYLLYQSSVMITAVVRAMTYFAGAMERYPEHAQHSFVSVVMA